MFSFGLQATGHLQTRIRECERPKIHIRKREKYICRKIERERERVSEDFSEREISRPVTFCAFLDLVINLILTLIPLFITNNLCKYKRLEGNTCKRTGREREKREGKKIKRKKNERVSKRSKEIERTMTENHYETQTPSNDDEESEKRKNWK